MIFLLSSHSASPWSHKPVQASWELKFKDSRDNGGQTPKKKESKKTRNKLKFQWTHLILIFVQNFISVDSFSPTLRFHHLGSGSAWVLELSFDRLRIYIKEISFFFVDLSRGIRERRDRENEPSGDGIYFWEKSEIINLYQFHIFKLHFFRERKCGYRAVCAWRRVLSVFYFSALPLMTSQNIQQQQDRAGPRKL